MEKAAFNPRKVKNDVPFGWTPTTIRGKPEWRCKDIQYNFKYKEFRRCSHCCEKKNIKHHRDRHVYEIPQALDDDFPKKLVAKIEDDKFNEFNDKYLEQLAILIGKLDISFRKASSDPIRQFSLYLLQTGFDIALIAKQEEFDFTNYLLNVSQNKIAEKLIDVSEKEFNKQIQKFKNKKFCSILCDAGTVMKNHCLHFVLTCFDENIRILFHTFDGSSFDSDFYFDCFTQIFEKLSLYNICVCALTTDNLPAQLKAWNTFHSTNDDPFIQAIFRVPCYAHMVNLIFSDSLQLSANLNKYINSAIDIAKLARKNDAVKFIGSKCPSFSQTRWLFIVDILLYLLSNRTEINNYIQILNAKDEKNFELIGSDIEFIYKLLVPLKLFSLTVEKNDFQLYNIVPLVREFFSELKMLYTCTEESTYREIISIIDGLMRLRIMNNAYSESVTAYALSGLGRAELRRKFDGIKTKNGSALSLTTFVKSLYNERMIFEKKLTPMYTDNIPIDNPQYFSEIDSEEEMELIAQNSDFDQIKNDFNEIMKIPFEERILHDVYKNIYNITSKELKSKGSILKIDEDYIEKCFDDFLFEDPTKLDFIRFTCKYPYILWQNAYCYDEVWEAFSLLALRYLCAFATEAIVERILSIQKYIQNSRMTNISTPVINARIRMHESVNSNKE